MTIIESTADQRNFLADFGTLATVTISGSPVTITGIFDAENVEIHLETGVEVSTDSPALYVLTSTISGIAQGNSVVVAGTTFYVSDYRKEGDGTFSHVLLHR